MRRLFIVLFALLLLHAQQPARTVPPSGTAVVQNGAANSLFLRTGSDYSIPINLNGRTYYIRLSSAP